MEARRPYRVLVTGSRDWPTPNVIWAALNNARNEAILAGRNLVVVHGSCPRGADAHAANWAEIARQFATGVSEERHRAEDFGPWPQCGPLRNRHMVSLGAELALAFIGPCTSTRCRKPRPHPSHGASGCADLAEAAGIPVHRFTA